jgi:hypothetical protein
MFLKYILFRTIMKNKIQEYEIRSDLHKEFHLQLSPDLFRHRHVASGDNTYTYHEPLLLK